MPTLTDLTTALMASFSLLRLEAGITTVAGTFAGPALRPVFGLTNPKPSDSIC